MNTSEAQTESAVPESTPHSSHTPGSARSRFIGNVGSNVVLTALKMLAMFWYVPFLIRHLGIAIYGVVPLANSIIGYAAIIADSLNIAINRFLSIDLNRSDEVSANKTFNTAILLISSFVLLLFPLGLGLSWAFPSLFHIEHGLERQAQLLFLSVTLDFCITLFGSNFAVVTLIFHRFDLRNLIEGVTVLVRIGIVVILFGFFDDQLWHVGIGFIASGIVFTVSSWLVSRRLTPYLRFNAKLIDRTRIRMLASLSSWAVVVRIGLLLFSSIDIIIVNIFFGAKITGIYGTLLLFSELIRTLAGTVSSVLSPAIMASYAQQNFEGMRTLAARAVKFLGIAIALPVGVLCGLGEPLLGIWLGSDFRHYNILLPFTLGHLVLNLATLPLAYVITSYNKVKVQGIATLVLGALNVGLTSCIAWWGGWGPVGVAASTGTMLMINNLFFLTIYSTRVMNIPWWTFYPKMAPSVIITVFVGIIGYSLTRLYYPENWLTLGGVALITGLSYALLAYGIGLNADDKRVLRSLVPAPFARYIR